MGYFRIKYFTKYFIETRGEQSDVNFYPKMFPLPSELNVVILSFLDIKTLLLNVMPTCRSFRDIIVCHASEMQEHVVTTEKTKGSTDFVEKQFETKTSDVLGRQTTKIKEVTTCFGSPWSIKETTGSFFRGKKHGLWVCVSSFGSQKVKTRTLWDEGYLRILHTYTEEQNTIAQYRGMAVSEMFPYRVFTSIGTPFECNGKKHTAYQRDDSWNENVYAHCCEKHQKILPKSLF
nr:hypothetical protein [Marseillevirus cajuinensis]